MADESDEWQSFHQQEDLTTRLHNILEEYPAGVGIFKEFLQNADDAGARKFAIVWDQRSHCSADGAGAGLLAPTMDEWQGPALYVYNDATFSDADFESISHVGRSGKHDDVAKIGKYGLGFNCAYHFTDVVSFITRDQLVVFDPHGTHLPRGLLGMRCNFIEKTLRDTHPAQAAPFVWEDTTPVGSGSSDVGGGGSDVSGGTGDAALSCFGGAVSMREPLDGTLFRLPLRTALQAERSAIVNHSFEEEDLRQMLHDFAEAA
jgi:sacsin